MSTSGKKILLSAAVVAAVVASFVASVVLSVAWPAASVAVFLAFAGATAGVVLRKRWAVGARWGALVGVALGAVVAFAVDGPLWALPVLGAGGAGWFVLRTTGKYLDPAVPLPAAVTSRLERSVTFAGESVAGLHVGARNDGAVFLVGYAGAVDPVVETAKPVVAFRASAASAIEILARQGIHTVTPLLVVDGTGIRTTFGDTTVTSLDMVAKVVERAEAPAFDDLIAAAEASGVQLNRAAARQVRSGRGQPNKSGAKGNAKGKVVHQGRVTRRTD